MFPLSFNKLESSDLKSGKSVSWTSKVRKNKTKIFSKLLVYFIFLILSFTFWLLNALSKDYTTTIDYPVQYVNFPKNKVLIGELPPKLSIRVSAYGFALMRSRIFSRFQPIIFDVESFVLPQVDAGSYLFHTKIAEDRISDQLGSEIKVLGISPDTIIFNFVPVARKEVPVVPQLKISADKQYLLKGNISVNPDHIIISGPKSVIDSITEIKTTVTRFKHIRKKIKKRIPLVQRENVQYSISSVDVSFEVEKYTEALLNVPIEAINVPNGLSLKIFPSTVKISYLVGISQYKNIVPGNFRAVVNYQQIEKYSVSRLPVSIVKKPKNINLLKLQPQNVEYLIEK
ncbi:MAG: CdaR family protein [Bacteroidota bacterium]|nr:CdaR family protein [Bacteroidota bacterium]MDP4273529.1 CdaR family protein [Bacteroidota bacterium]